MDTKITIRGLTFAYNGQVVLDGVDADFPAQQITAITGPSGQGKSTLLTAINRLADEIPGAKVKGEIEIKLTDGAVNVYRDKYYLPDLRRKVGLVFQKPNPLPMGIMAMGKTGLPLIHSEGTPLYGFTEAVVFSAPIVSLGMFVSYCSTILSFCWKRPFGLSAASSNATWQQQANKRVTINSFVNTWKRIVISGDGLESSILRREFNEPRPVKKH